MNFLKRTLGILIAAVILTSVFATAASAADTSAVTTSASSESAAKGKAGANCSWSFNTKTGVLTISGSGAMYDFFDEDDEDNYPVPRPWNKYNSDIKSVVIENGITSIGIYSFLDCVNLETATLPDTVTKISDGAFEKCTSLISVNVPDNVSEIGALAFCGCASLKSISIPSGIKELLNVFYNCESLESVYITDLEAWKKINFNCKEANPIYYAHNLYLNNKLVTEVNFAEGTEKIGDYVFDGAECIERITIPDSVKSVGQYAFTNTGYFKNTANWENGVLYIDKCLFRVKKGTAGKVDIKDGTTLIADKAFYECESLKELSVPASLKYVGSNSFENASCTSVNIKDLKAWCEIDFDGFGYYSNPICGKKEFYLNGELVENLIIPEGITELKDYTFCGYDGLKTVKISDGVTRIGYDTFRYCENLESVDIPASVTKIDGGFEGCKKLKKVNISDIGAWSRIDFADQYSNPLYDMHDLYLNNELVTEVNIPEGVEKIGVGAFAGCTNIKSFTLSESVNKISSLAFYGCKNAKAITLPSNMTTIGYGAFMNCSSLESINIPEGIKDTDNNTFQRCKNLKTVTFPSTLKTIGAYTFYKCSNLERAKLPEGLKEIKGDAFRECKKLSISIPKSLKDIGYGAFAYCKKVYNKLNNPMKVNVKKKTIKLSAKQLRKKSVSVKLLKMSDYREEVKASKVKKGTSKKIYKKVKIKNQFWNSGDTRSTLTLSKGYYKNSTYTVKINVKAWDDCTNAYKTKNKTVTIKLKIK